MRAAAADLNEISLFVRVAQLGSFSAAARASGIPLSTVSRKIAELERRLGVGLIKRTTRKLSLSEHGLRFYEACAPHVQGLEQAEASLSEAGHLLQGVLRVTAPITLGRGELIDFVSRFMAKHPGLQIDLTITNQFVDLVATQVDVAIRYGALEDSSAIAKRLGVSLRVPMAAPGYLKERGTPRTPAALGQHACILFPSKPEGLVWQLQNGRRRAKVRVYGALSANNLETVHELALRGHGVAMLPEWYAAPAQPGEALQRILAPWSSPPIPVHAVYLNRKFVPAKLQAFLSELSSWKTHLWRKEAAA
jgi:DNA-binding transcriptional LysR family regulator